MWQKLKFIFFLAIIACSCDAHEIDIGDGRKMYMDCEGKGTPPVVFISGRSDRSDIWQPVLQAVAKFTSVCAYDRPGTFTIKGDSVEVSRSTSVSQPITPKKAVLDLHALLRASQEQAPYVLVAHSFGGLIARLYASTYPDKVVGLVLVDTLTEFLYEALPKEKQALWIRLNSNYSPELEQYLIQERTDFIPSFEQLQKAPPIKPIPTIVLTSDQTYDFKDLIKKGNLPPDAPIDFGPIIFKAHLEGQKQLTELLHAKQITNTHASHYIHSEQPQMVIDAIREVVEKVRSLNDEL